MSYIVPCFNLPEGYNHEEFIRELYDNAHTPEEIERNKEIIFRLIYPIGMKIIRKWDNYRIPMDDAHSDIALAFMLTYKNYDPTAEKVSFTAYFKRALECRLVYTKYGKYRKNEEFKNTFNLFNAQIISLESPVKDDNASEKCSISQIIKDKRIEDSYAHSILKSDIKNAIKIVEKQYGDQKSYKIYKYYIELIFTDRYATQQKIADELGVTRSYVSRIIDRYNQYLRNLLEKGEM